MDLDPDEVFRDDEDDPDNPLFQVHIRKEIMHAFCTPYSISLVPFDFSLLNLEYRKGSRRKNWRFTWWMLLLKCSARAAPPWVFSNPFVPPAALHFHLFQCLSCLWFCNGWMTCLRKSSVDLRGLFYFILTWSALVFRRKRLDVVKSGSYGFSLSSIL